jgi:hypothetical protein
VKKADATVLLGFGFWLMDIGFYAMAFDTIEIHAKAAVEFAFK